MATATITHAPNLRKRPRTKPADPPAATSLFDVDSLRVETLWNYVQRVYPQHFKESCDYYCLDGKVYREKVWLGDPIDTRQIGELPPGLVADFVLMDVATDYVIGTPAAVARAKELEADENKHKVNVCVLFYPERKGVK